MRSHRDMMTSLHLLKAEFLKNRVIIFVGLLSLIFVDYLQLFIPRLIKGAIDGLTLYRINAGGLLRYAAMIMVTGFCIGIFRYVWRRCLLGTSRRVEESLRNRLFAHIQTLTASYFDRTKTGDLMAHATNDIAQIQMATGMGLVALNDAVVLGLASIGFMAYIHLRLTLYVLIPMPFIALSSRYFSKRMHQRYQQVQASFSEVTETVREAFAGIRVVKANHMENDQHLRVKNVSRRYITSNLQLIRVTGAFYPMMVLFTNISMALVLYLGGRKTILAEITPGDFVAFISYLGLLTWPMMALGWVTNLIQRGRASLDRINTILTTHPEISAKVDALSIASIRSKIVFEKVSFDYSCNGSKILSNIDLDIHQGQTLGVIGPPGGGKSTLLYLIPRLYDVTQGQILIDGVNIKKLNLTELRSLIAYVPQEPFLFAGTIRDNITFGIQAADEDRLNQAVEMAAVAETIRSFPMGFDTVVGEKGVILSGGQKQRIALARAFFKEASLLLLDDPISQVDSETGSRILDAVQSQTASRTLVIVSHRLSAVRFADRIITLDNGRIVESGHHQALIDQGGYYSRAYGLQEIVDAV
jgi:ATP-binding cassette subfamily B multidrug efflux pump